MIIIIIIIIIKNNNNGFIQNFEHKDNAWIDIIYDL